MRIIQKALIGTQRLELRPLSEADVEGLADILANEEVSKTFMVPQFKDRAQAVDLARKLVGFSSISNEEHLVYGVFLNGSLIGFVNDCGFSDSEIEIGYVIDPRFWGSGYATEAVRAVLDDLHDMGFERVVAGYFENNIASLRVMEKCNMKRIDRIEHYEYRGVTHKCLYCEKTFV